MGITDSMQNTDGWRERTLSAHGMYPDKTPCILLTIMTNANAGLAHATQVCDVLESEMGMVCMPLTMRGGAAA